MLTLNKLKALLAGKAEVGSPRTVDEQYEALVKGLDQQSMSEDRRLRSQYPKGWFKMMTRQGYRLTHWCPNCKTLSEGKTAIHCGSRKREPRPTSRLRIALLPKAYWRLF